MEDILTYVQAALAIIGALKIIARYTPWEGDDKALEIVEKPILFVVGFVKPKSK